MEDGDQFANCKWGEKKIIKETIKKAAPASASSSMRTPVSEPLFVKPRREAEKKRHTCGVEVAQKGRNIS